MDRRMRWRARAGVPTALLAVATMMSGAAAQDASPTMRAGPGLLGATTEVWRDDLSAPSTWEVLSDDTGATAYTDGQLAMSVTADRQSVWDDHQLDRPWPVLRMEAWVATTGEGMAGVGCGSSLGLPRWLWAGTDGAGGWLWGRIIDTRLQVVDRGELPVQVDGRHVTLAIECASDPATGGDHVSVTTDGVQVATGFDIPVGPFDKATLLVSADTAPEEARFDDVVVLAGEAYDPVIDGSLSSPAP